MEWREEGTVLGRRAHGERALILEVLTTARGRHLGVVPGAASGRRSAQLQPGARLMLHWRARTDEQIGTFAAEPLRSRAALMLDAASLDGLGRLGEARVRVALGQRPAQERGDGVEAVEARRIQHQRLAEATEALLDAMLADPGWPARYLQWEMLLLDEMGFGLDLHACAVTGATRGLAYVSPATGRAVTREGAGEYAPRLLPLPTLLGGPSGGMAEGLALTGHFLDSRLARTLVGRPVPAARARLAARLPHLLFPNIPGES